MPRRNTLPEEPPPGKRLETCSLQGGSAGLSCDTCGAVCAGMWEEVDASKARCSGQL